MKASAIAQKAADLVGGDRDRQHGAKRDNFDRIAEMWNAWMRVRSNWGEDLTGHDVGVMMALLKIARTQSGSLNEDDYIDGAGYLACAGEIAAEDAPPKDDVWGAISKAEKAAAKSQSIWIEDPDPLAR